MLLPNSISQRPGRGAQAGFSMVEIALALAVIGFALVAIIGVLPIGMSVQKDNRQDTVVGMDANYLMSAIRSGANGADVLTNHIIVITNYSAYWSSPTNIPTVTNINWFTTTNYCLDPNVYQAAYLTNGSNIIGLLSIPKYMFDDAQNINSGFRSNFTTADFRGLSSPLMDQGVSPSSRDFSFTYRVYPQVIPYGQFENGWIDYAAAGLPPDEVINRHTVFTNATTFRSAMNHLRLRYEWPVLPRGDTGNGRQVFRTMAGGYITNVPPTAPNTPRLSFILPQTYISPYSQ